VDGSVKRRRAFAEVNGGRPHNASIAYVALLAARGRLRLGLAGRWIPDSVRERRVAPGTTAADTQRSVGLSVGCPWLASAGRISNLQHLDYPREALGRRLAVIIGVAVWLLIGSHAALSWREPGWLRIGGWMVVTELFCFAVASVSLIGVVRMCRTSPPAQERRGFQLTDSQRSHRGAVGVQLVLMLVKASEGVEFDSWWRVAPEQAHRLSRVAD
jgi:hypothetical protein